MKNFTRRNFMRITGTGIAVTALSPVQASLASPTPPPTDMIAQLGLASYSTRKLSLDETIKWAKTLGLRHVSLKDFHLPFDASDSQFEEVKAKMKEADLDFYGVGVIYMKTREDVDRAFEYARKAGVKMIIAAPLHEFLDYTEQKIKEYDIRVAIHNHGPGDLVYPTVESAYEKLKGRDARFGLCMDIGHTYRINEDPDGVMKKFKDRMLDIHVKDVTSRGKEGATVEMGRGQIDIAKFLRSVQSAGYKGYLSFEYEKDGNSPIPGLAESVGYIRGVIKSIF